MNSPSESHLQPYDCPAEGLLRLLSGKWKPQIIRVASQGPFRFNGLLRQLPASNKQAIAVAIRELEDAGILHKDVIRQKPLHIEYSMTERGESMLSIFKMAAALALAHKSQ